MGWKMTISAKEGKQIWTFVASLPREREEGERVRQTWSCVVSHHLEKEMGRG